MLDISPVLLLSSGVIFLLVLARLNTCLFKPLLRHMDEREESIKKDFENAKSNGVDVDGKLQQANDIIAEAKKEAALIREQAYKEAKSSMNAKLAKAKDDLEVKTSQFKEELQKETVALKESLKASLPEYAKSLKNKLETI